MTNSQQKIFGLNFLLGAVFLYASSEVKAQQTLPPHQEPAQNATASLAAAPENFVQIAAVPNIETPKSVSETSSKLAANLTARTGVDPSQTLTLTISDAVRRALENNNSIEVARSDVRINEAQLRSQLGIYDPVFTIQPTYSRSARNGSASSHNFFVNGGVTTNLKSGGVVEAFSNNSRTGTGSQFADPTITRSSIPFYSTALGVNFNQPLWRNREIDNVRRQIKIQRKRIEQSDAEFRRTTIETIAQVQSAYWDLVFALRDQQNRQSNLNLSKENLRQIEARIEAGTAAPLQRAEVSTELATREADVLLAAQQVTISENTLKQLILRDPASPEWQVTIVPVDRPVFDEKPASTEDAIREAVANRPELRRLKLQREITEIDREFYRNQTKPEINLVSSFSLNGLAQNIPNYTPTVTTQQFLGNDALLLNAINQERAILNNPNLPQIPNSAITVSNGNPNVIGGVGRAFVNIFGTDAINYSVGVQINFPLRNKTAKANLELVEAQQTQLAANERQQEQIVIVEVRNAVQSLETARQRVLAARRARENAEIQLNGERALLDAGRSTTFLLIQRENALTNARNAEIRAETDYNKAVSSLQRATSTTLEVNNIVIDSGMTNQR